MTDELANTFTAFGRPEPFSEQSVPPLRSDTADANLPRQRTPLFSLNVGLEVAPELAKTVRCLVEGLPDGKKLDVVEDLVEHLMLMIAELLEGLSGPFVEAWLARGLFRCAHC